MAQPGNFTPIMLYSSSTTTNVPLAANLTNSTNGAELAINIADKNLFFKDSGGAVNTVPIRQSSTSSNGWLSNTDWNTFNGKAPATSGTSLLYGNGLGGFSNVTIGSGITFAGGTLSATGSGGTVTSVTGTSPVVSSGGTTPAISLATAYGDTLNPYASKTAKYVLAAPNATAGVPTFRQLANTDITGLGTMSTQNANSIAITGGTLNGVAIGGTTAGDGTFNVLTGNTSRLGIATGTSFVATNGLSSTSTFTGTAPTDGIVIDYSTGYGRFSAFTGDGYQWYTGGIGTTKIMDLSSAGALVTSGTVTANGVLLTGNLGTVTSVTGTSPVVSSGGTTPTISMPAATTSVSGYLTSTDWNTFNNKGSGTVTSVTGTAPVVSSGGATPAISMAAATSSVNGYLTSTDWTTFNNKGSGTVTSVAALTLGTTGTDLSSTVATGSTTPVITLNVPTASATNRGALSAADWTTFNNKGSGTVTSVAATVPAFLSISGSPITTSGTLAISYSGTALPVANGGTGLTTLTAGYIPYGNGTSAFASSANLYFSGANLGLGTSTPSSFGGYTTLSIGNTSTTKGLITFRDGAVGDVGFVYFNGTNFQFEGVAAYPVNIAAVSGQPLLFSPGGGEKARIFASGGVSIGNTTDGGAYSLMVGAIGKRAINAQPQYVDNESWNGAATAIYVGKSSGTGRSLNLAGTVNINGLDYAEYMVKAGNFILNKGDICGIDVNGKLTNVFADAISFVVKSTSPSYVGGDTWGTGLEGDALELARQTVDRIAFCGQVPVNVTGATAGQYIVPVVNQDGSIGGISIANPTFEQYQLSVGKVIFVINGKPTIIVKVT